MIARVIAPNLTRSVRLYSTEELVGIIRHGVRPDGRSVLVMPSSMFVELSDRELGATIAYLRSLPETPGHAPDVQLGPMARFALATGKFIPVAVESDSMEKLSNVYPDAPDSIAQGAYLARTACTECHGLDLTGDKSGTPPDLKIAGAYPLEGFVTLMRTGKPLDGRDLGLMTEVALSRFSHFTDAEIGSLHAFLSARWRASTSR
jgi:mono/diheme cytochrome c family protein